MSPRRNPSLRRGLADLGFLVVAILAVPIAIVVAAVARVPRR